jgi:hypothetical protein
MTAKILPFPKPQPVLKKPEVNKSFELIHCWNTKFGNPYLNTLYQDHIPYVQRWYYEITHGFNIENLNSISKQVVFDDDFRLSLIKACELDLDLCKQMMIQDEYSMVAQSWTVKLRKWRGRFHACRLVA